MNLRKATLMGTLALICQLGMMQRDAFSQEPPTQETAAPSEVFIAGLVGRPGVYSLNIPLTLKQLIVSAGMAEPGASHIQIIRRQGEVQLFTVPAISLQDLFEGRIGDPRLHPNDIVQLSDGEPPIDWSDAAAHPPVPADFVPPNREYRLEADDLVTISVTGGPFAAPAVLTKRVRKSGGVSLGDHGEVDAAGLTAIDLAEAVTRHFGDTARVSVEVVEARGNIYSIMGLVEAPGQFKLEDGMTLAAAIARVKPRDGTTKLTILRQVRFDDDAAAGAAPMPIFMRAVEVDTAQLQQEPGKLPLHPRDLIIVR